MNNNAHEGMVVNTVSLNGNIDKYLQWNLSVFPIQRGKNILDLGCGPGFYFRDIFHYEPMLYFATDYSEKFLDDVKRLANGMPNCVVKKLDLTDNNIANSLGFNRFDYILCLDVLEHIEDDRQALYNIRNIMKNTGKGRLFLRVPALQLIYGENDRAIGHFRRYSKNVLKKLLQESGFEVESIRYQNILGILPWYVIGNILKRSLAVSSREGNLFNWFVPIIRKIEEVVSPPLGLSLYTICSIKD